MYSLYTIANPSEYRYSICILAYNNKWKFIENTEKFFDISYTPFWDMEDPALGQLIDSADSLEELFTNNPEFFI